MKRSLKLLLSALSGVLLSLAWLGFPGWILFIAFIPLLLVERDFTQQKEKYRTVVFWSYAFLASFIWNVLSTWWILHATLAGAIMAIITNSLLMSVVWWLGHAARRKFRSNLGYLALAVFWISFEYFHFHWDIEWPWLQLGNGFANNVKSIQWYEFTGAFGGTLWVWAVNLILFSILQRIVKMPAKNLIPEFAFLMIVVFVPLFISIHLYNNHEETGKEKNIVVIQPNVNPYSEAYDMRAETKKKDTFLRLAAQHTNNTTDFIIGPETVFENPTYWNENQLRSNGFIRQLNHFIYQFEKPEMLFGVSSYKPYASLAEATPTARVSGDVIYDRFNTALFLSRQGETKIYHKSKLVVGVEKMPFLKYLGFIRDIVINIGGTTGSLGRQKEASNFIAKDGTKVAPVICYESVFGEYVTDYVKKGAELIFIITNDGWWKNTPGYKQHMSFARLRAIETRRSIARSANTGISCFINQRGDVMQPTGWWVEASISGKIKTNKAITFYTKHGDYIARVALFSSVLLLLLMVVKRYK